MVYQDKYHATIGYDQARRVWVLVSYGKKYVFASLPELLDFVRAEVEHLADS